MSSQERIQHSRPPLSSLDEPESLRSILPRPLTTLVGRRADVRYGADLLIDGRTRLLTLTGPGGVGKTRLALAMAEETVHEFPHGIVFVGLADVLDPDLVIPVIARVIGTRDESGGSAFERLSRRLEPLRALLVLDNLEQVLPVAPRLAELLQACPALSILVTSRVPLRIRGEIEHHVLPLALPEPAKHLTTEEVSASESVSLFQQIVQGYDPRFEITAENATVIGDICRRLDGLPLAIELAASRLRSLTPETLLGMLENRLPVLTHGPSDLPQRHRTLRHAIQWSYDLLAPEDQALFRAAAACSGSFGLSALQAITAYDEMQTLDGIGRLLEHHLVRRLDIFSGTPRYWMLETIRDFGTQTADERGETEELRRHHAGFVMSLTSEASAHLTSQDQMEWLDRLELDHDNIRSALTWLVEDDPAGAARMVHELWRFWWARGYLREGRSIAERILSVRASLPKDELAILLYTIGELTHCLSDLDASRTYFDDALKIMQELNRPELTTACLNARGIVARDQGDLRGARAMHQEALTLAESAGITRQVASSLNNLGAVAYYLGETEDAHANWQKAVDILGTEGDRRAYSMAIGNLGVVEGILGNLDRAIALKEESLQIARELRDPEATLTAMASLSGLLLEAGHEDRAETLLQEALPQTGNSGDARIRATMLHTLAVLVGNRGDHRTAARYFSESLLLLARSGQLPGVATDLEGLARTASMVGLHEDAVRMFGAARAIREQTGAVRESITDREKDDELLASRAAFPRARADELWREGTAWTLGEIVMASSTFPDRVLEANARFSDSNGGNRLPSHPFGLTERELEILGYLVRHYTDREIGEALFISPRTVTTHVTSIINKLGVSSRREAARLADQHRLIG